MVSRLISILVSTLLLAGLGVLTLKGVTSLESHATVTTQELVKAGSNRIEFDLQQQGRDLGTIAERFAAEQGFATDLKALTAVLALSPPSGKVPDRLKTRIDGLKAKLQEQVAVLKEEKPHLTAVTVVDENGLVLVTDSPVFRIGDRLALPKEEPTDASGGDAVGDALERGAPKPPPKPAPQKAPPPKNGFTLTALDDEVQQVTVVETGGVKWIGAAPIRLRGTIVGAVILEQKLQNLAHAPGIEAMLLIGDAVTLGKPPKGFDVAAVRDTDQAYVLIERSPPAVVPGLGELPFGPLFVDHAVVGVWVQRFAIPGATGARGLVFADVTPLYSELAGFQVLVLLLLLGVWLGHVVILMLSGTATRRGIDRVADFLGRVNQGIGEERQLSEQAVPKSLGRLVLLVNKALERTAGGAPVAPLARSPSLDDVLQAQQADPAPDVSDLEFKGITDSGSLGMKARSSTPPTPPDADGFESMGEVAKAVEQEMDAQPTAAAQPDTLPAEPEAEAAIDHLAEASEPTPASSAETQVMSVVPTTPAPEARAELTRRRASPVSAVLSEADFAPPLTSALASDNSAEAPKTESGAPPLGDLLDEHASDATTMMQLSPQLMAAMREASRTADKKQQATDKVSSNVAAADAALAELETVVAKPSPDAPPKKLIPTVAPTHQASPPVNNSFDSQATNVMPLAVAKQMAAKLAAQEPAAPVVNPHYREVFDQFVEARKKCGEGVADLTFDKFVAKLHKSREAVMAKHQCTDVRFQVYVKEGKAALKALPAR